MELGGKTALITGGGSGIGLGIALALAREGCRVAISGRNEEKLRQAADLFQEQPLLTRTCDVSDRADVMELVAWFNERLGVPDILVNSAGINIPQPQAGIRRRTESSSAIRTHCHRNHHIGVTGVIAQPCSRIQVPQRHQRGRCA